MCYELGVAKSKVHFELLKVSRITVFIFCAGVVWRLKISFGFLTADDGDDDVEDDDDVRDDDGRTHLRQDFRP